MEIPTVKAVPREERGRRECNRLRRKGLVPANMYGRGKPNEELSIAYNSVQSFLEDHILIFNVQKNGDQTPVQLLEVQYDSLGDEILHVDLGRISMSETVEVAVAVETKGDPVGVREEGGVLELIQHELVVECLPGSIPEQITVDVSEMSIGDDVRVEDLELPEGVTPVDDPDSVVVVCAAPMEMVTEEDEEMLEEDVMAEPEVIGAEEEEEEEWEEEEGEEAGEAEEEGEG